MNKTYQHPNLEQADFTLNGIVDLIVEGIWDWHAKTGKVTRSPGWYRMLGYEIGALKEDVFTWENIIHPEDYSAVMAHFEDYVTGRVEQYKIEYRCKMSDGSFIWIIDRGNIIERNNDGSVARMIGAHHNINQQKIVQQVVIQQNTLLKEGNDTLEKIVRKKADELHQKNKELEQKIAEIESISCTDSLTKVANRKRFEQELSKEVSRANRYNHPLSLVIFDIDHFKQINDSYGHKVGDALLCNLSKLVSDNVRTLDLLARWGGEEFVIILPELTAALADRACEKLRLLINKQQLLPNINISCSFGVTQFTCGDTIDSLFQRADNLLFDVKKQGRNQVKSS